MLSKELKIWKQIILSSEQFTTPSHRQFNMK
jgi:hypothetical protein